MVYEDAHAGEEFTRVVIWQRERHDAHRGRTSIGVGTCLRLNLEPRRLLHHRHRSLAALALPGTLVNRLHRLRDRRHTQWSRRPSPSLSARTSALRSMTRYLAYFRQIGSSIEDAGADCPRSGSFGPDPIWIHGSVGCLLWIRGSVGCVFYAFSILRFPPYGMVVPYIIICTFSKFHL